MNLFELVPKLEMEPELAQLGRLLEDNKGSERDGP